MPGSEPPLVSVVMPTWNQAGYLREAIRSVLLQDDPRWELIIIDNFSDDDTAGVAGSFADTRIRYEAFRNNGVIAASRNRGIGLARGRCIAFLDSDDLWYPGKLSACLRAMTPEVDAVCHGMRIREDGDPAGALVPTPGEEDLYRSLLFHGNSSIATSSVVVRRECLGRAGGFSEDPAIASSEDYELLLRLARTGARFSLLPDILGEYTVHRAGTSRNIRRQSEAEALIVAREFRTLPGDSPAMGIRRRARTGQVHLRAARRFQAAGMYREALGAMVRSARAFVGLAAP
jgi:glycosyltransferase involved in cell wall biosynthesis